MAKVMITLSDDGEGGVDIQCEFDPPASKGQTATTAQCCALTILESLNPGMVEGTTAKRKS